MTFIDLPIEGDKTRGYEMAEQLPREQLADAFKAVFAFDEIAGVRWTQYTPYFNDGDACVFNTGEIYIQFADSKVDEDEDYDEYVNRGGFCEPWDDIWSAHLGGSTYSYETKKYVETPGPNPALSEAVDTLCKAIGPQHYVSLLDLFGDHAEVTATREKFSIDFYEHD